MKEIVRKKEKQSFGKRVRTWGKRLLRNIKRDKALLLIILPVVLHYLVFVYYPMYGNIIAFKKYSAV